MKINGKHIMFKAENNRITPFEIVKETPAKVTFKQERLKWDSDAKDYVELSQNKKGSYHQWTETFAEAKQWLMEKVELDIDRAKSHLERQQKYFDSIMRLVEPKIIVKDDDK